MKDYPDLDKLKTYFDVNRILIKRDQSRDILSFKSLELILNNTIFIIFIDDEYNDVNVANQLMCFFLILRELEIYNDSTDYLDWCKQNGINANEEQLRQYYITLAIIYPKIEKILGKIDSCISSMDYQLSTGIVQKLRGIQ